MQPTTLRLPEELGDELATEADELGFSSRSEYIRHILRNRSDTGPNTQRSRTDTEPNTHDYARSGRLDELEKRVAALEAELHPDNSGRGRESRETPTQRAESRHDPQPSESERRDEEASSGTGFAGLGEIVANVDVPAGGEDRKRDGLLEALRILRERGTASTSELREAAWTVDSESYGSPDSWWSNIWKGAGREGAGDQLRDMGLVELENQHTGKWRWVGSTAE